MTFRDPKFNAAVRGAMLAASEPIALGWDLLRKERTATGIHITEKEIFLSGAGYMFDAIIHSLTEGAEPNPVDLHLMEKFHAELSMFHEHFNKKLRR